MDQGNQELLSLLAGDPDGHFRLLVQVYQQRLYRFALRLAGRPEDAEDIVQEAFLHAYYALKVHVSRAKYLLRQLLEPRME